MQNIDPVLFVQPALTIAMSVGAVVYWRHRRGFRGIVIGISFIAYSIAIAAKTGIQLVSADAVANIFGSKSVGFGLYLGLQTVFLEIGLAYVLAWYGSKRWRLKSTDGVAYGVSLAFWENGVLLGVLALFNLAVVYALLSTDSSLSKTVYDALAKSQSSYFLPPSALLPSVLLGTLERLSSILAHVAWGTLCVLAVLTRRGRYLGYALPMGLIDAAVPFATLNLDLFEAGIFLLSVGFVFLAWRSFEGVQSTLRPDSKGNPSGPVP